MEKFIEIKENVENVNKALKVFEPDFNYLCFSKYEYIFLDALKEAMNDEYDWIDYFIYELNFGKKAKKDSVTEKGKNIPIKTIDNLYNLITKNKWK